VGSFRLERHTKKPVVLDPVELAEAKGRFQKIRSCIGSTWDNIYDAFSMNQTIWSNVLSTQ
jgi:hypothetical protein